MLDSGKKQYRMMDVIRSYLHDVYTEEVNKVALSTNDDKRVILEDKIHTLTHGHYKLQKLIYNKKIVLLNKNMPRHSEFYKSRKANTNKDDDKDSKIKHHIYRLHLHDILKSVVLKQHTLRIDDDSKHVIRENGIHTLAHSHYKIQSSSQ